MSKKKRKAERTRSAKDEQLSPIELLVSGKIGPLPIEVEGGVFAPTSDETPYPEPDDSFGLIEYLMETHPGLTKEEAQEMIDAFG